MKKNLITFIFGALILIISTTPALARGGWGMKGGGGAAAATYLPMEDLSEAEAAALTWMVEEEKLARDVYLALYEKWEIPAFANIAQSEQRHMDAVGSLLTKYSLSNPTEGLDQGSFQNPELQDLYNSLVASGSESVEQAIRVGCTIEDLDIKDLNERLEETDNQDITLVFGNLKRGSENHMRAFSSLLAVYGFEPYEAQFLSQEEIDEILASAPSKGMGMGRGGRGGWRN